MADISKISPDDGSTILNIKDSNAVHWGEQSKGYVGKNLLNLKYSKVENASGVTYTKNADNSISAIGTPTAYSSYKYDNGSTTYDAIGLTRGQSYILTGCPSGSSNTISNWIKVYFSDNTDQMYEEHGDGITINLPDKDIVGVRCGCYIDVRTSVNLTFYPMLRRASIIDDTYEPYICPNTEISEKMTYADNTVLGAKNLLECKADIGSYPNYNNRGIDITINDDYTVEFTGTSTNDVYFSLYARDSGEPLKGLDRNTQYIISSETTNDKVYVYVNMYNSSKTWVRAATGKINETIFTITDDIAYIEFGVSVQNGTTVSNQKIYPMIRLATDTDSTYVPYAMTNRELTDELTVKSYTPTITGSTISSVSVIFQKYGKVVTMLAQFKSSLTVVNDTDTLFTLPQEYRPISSINFRTYDIGSSCTDENQEIEILSTGATSLKIRNTHNTGRWICANITYIVN